MNGADRRMETRDPNESGSSPSASENYDRIGPKRYSYEELATVTGHFSHNNLIGRGGFGHVFKASLDGETRAIKRLDYPGVESEGDLEREIMVVKSISHKNLVELIGYCIDGANRLLILKYFPNGSLRSKLDGKENVLDWKKRMNIAIGSARGLEYLHEHCKPKIIHLDIKPDNILLDEHFEPKITDFGLAHFFTGAATHISKSSVMGTQVFDHVFKASLDGEIRAIKRLDFPDVQFEEGLEREIMVVKSISHKNLVELVGYCIHGANRLLIFKYFPNGSLRSKLHGSGDVLDWEKRMKIAVGCAKGLEYLHEHCEYILLHIPIWQDFSF